MSVRDGEKLLSRRLWRLIREYEEMAGILVTDVSLDSHSIATVNGKRISTLAEVHIITKSGFDCIDEWDPAHTTPDTSIRCCNEEMVVSLRYCLKCGRFR